jgi:hypothetical protein
MPWYRQYVVNEEADGDNTDAGGGGVDGKPASDNPAEGAPAAGAAPAKDAPADMATAIDQALGYAKKPDEKPPEQETPEAKAEREKKEGEENARKALEAKAAAGDQAALQQLEAKKLADEKAKREAAAKPKDLKALELTPEEKKATSAKTQARFNEVLGIARTERAAREAAEQQVVALAGARDAILNVLKETNTTDDDLAALLEYNRLTKSTKPQDLEGALAVIERQRGFLLKALGKAGPGEDPLTAHPDLQKEIEDLKITKERALEIAEARRREAINRRAQERQQQDERSSSEAKASAKKAQETALSEIERWGQQQAASDLDYKAKEDRVLAAIEEVVREYPPHLWLPTIKRLYGAIVVQKAPAVPGKEQQPLRPSGAKPGGPAPKDMAEAIDQALGYAGK